MFKDFVIAAVLTESARLVNQRREGTRLGLRLLHYKMCQPSRRMCFPFLTLNDLEQTFRVQIGRDLQRERSWTKIPNVTVGTLPIHGWVW